MPDVAKNQDLTLQDMRVIIHGLKMSGFAYIEPEALDQIKFRIKSLPNPEELNSLGDDPASLKRIAKEVGEIMKLLEAYGKKGPEFKARFESLKGMPPRYKVLEWRKANMNNTEFVRQVIRLSAVVDSKGHGDLAIQLNSLAKNAMENKETQEEVLTVTEALSSVNMEKEAQGIRGWFRDRGQAKRNVKQEQSDLKILTQIQNGIWQARQQLENGIKNFNEGMKNVNTFVNQIANPNRKAKAQQVVTQFNINIEGVDDVFGDTSYSEDSLKKMIQELRGNVPAQTAPEAATEPTAPATAAPSGIPEAKDAATASDYAKIIENQLASFTSSKRRILIAATPAPASDPFIPWFQANKEKPEALQQALEFYRSKAGAAPAAAGTSGLPLFDMMKDKKPAAPAAPAAATATPPVTTPPATTAGGPVTHEDVPPAPPAPTTGGPAKTKTAQEFLASLKPVMGADGNTVPEMYQDETGQQYRITKASNGKLTILKRIA